MEVLNKESVKKIRWLLIIIVPVVVFSVVLPWWWVHVGILLSPAPPTPVNTYGEFPFRIVFEVGDERHTIEDLLICEFVGVGASDTKGKHLDWSGRLKSGNKVSRGFLEVQPGQGNEWKYGNGLVVLEDISIGNGYIGQLLIDLGSPQYYLGYYDFGDYRPGAVYNDGQGVLDADTLWEQYEFRIIEVEFSEPMIGDAIDMT